MLNDLEWFRVDHNEFMSEFLKIFPSLKIAAMVEALPINITIF